MALAKPLLASILNRLGEWLAQHGSALPCTALENILQLESEDPRLNILASSCPCCLTLGDSCLQDGRPIPYLRNRDHDSCSLGWL